MAWVARQKGGGAGALDAEQIAVVGGEPERVPEAGVDVRAGVQERPHEFQVAGPLLLVLEWLRVPGLGRPVHVEDRVQRGGSGVAGQVGVGAAREELRHEVEVAVDRGDQHRRGVVGRAAEVDGGAAVEEGPDGGGVAFPGGQVDGRQAAVFADQAGVVEGDGFTGATLGFDGLPGGVAGLGGA